MTVGLLYGSGSFYSVVELVGGISTSSWRWFASWLLTGTVSCDSACSVLLYLLVFRQFAIDAIVGQTLTVQVMDEDHSKKDSNLGR